MWYPSLEFIEPFREFKFCDLFECYFWFFHSKLKHNFCSDLTSKQYWFQNNIVKFESLHKSRVLKSSVHFSILCCSPKWNLFKLLLELTFFWLVGTTCNRILPIKFPDRLGKHRHLCEHAGFRGITQFSAKITLQKNILIFEFVEHELHLKEKKRKSPQIQLWKYQMSDATKTQKSLISSVIYFQP